ncbi:VIT1/CCC1 transporter family protein [Corynebacterium sp. LK2590]|nr:VIT1/CCC1 transporter family protein [Mycobacteriaceae bacterium]MDY5829708.1 VIT1/CCC1 transporter family protein [Corynebacterium sp.]
MPMQATGPTKKQINRWRRYLANERAEAAVYRELARKKEGEERSILLQLAESESRHEQYWRDKLGDAVGFPRKPDLSTRALGFMAQHFGSVFTLALMQTAETRTPYTDDIDASDQMAADEHVHAEVVRGLATRGREKMSGNFRAAVFGANDGLVSNLALVIGVMGSGAASTAVLLTGISGLLAGALSMAAGEYVSVKSQSELLEASRPAPDAHTLVPDLDVNANELALIYRARGMGAEAAETKAEEVFDKMQARQRAAHPSAGLGAMGLPAGETPGEADGGAPGVIGQAWSAALSSFCFFATGAFIPIIPFLFGASTTVGAVVALVLVAIALMFTGGVVGVISGKPPLKRALRQLLIGLGAAGITYLLGVGFAAFIG